MVTTLLSTPAPLPDPVVGGDARPGPERRVAAVGRAADARQPRAELPLDANERAAVAAFVEAGLVAPQEAAGLRARREAWGAYRAVS
ncbi:MAG TPA: hypothetical protein VFJ12_06970 [Segeticoccus sp.]|nr:hypothetical protein [Segeticoccus sp.]